MFLLVTKNTTRNLMLAHKSGKGADIRTISHADIAMMAEGGYIL